MLRYTWPLEADLFPCFGFLFVFRKFSRYALDWEFNDVDVFVDFEKPKGHLEFPVLNLCGDWRGMSKQSFNEKVMRSSRADEGS